MQCLVSLKGIQDVASTCHWIVWQNLLMYMLVPIFVSTCPPIIWGLFFILFMIYVYLSNLKYDQNFSCRPSRSDPLCPSFHRSEPRLNETLPFVEVGRQYLGSFDHQFISRSSWMFAQVFLAPNAFGLMIKGLTRLRARQMLWAWKLINPVVDHHKLVFTFIMNTSCAMYVESLDHANSSARFKFTNLPIFSRNLDGFTIAKDFEVELNLQTKMMEVARLDSKTLTGPDAFVLLVLHFGTIGHVLNHSYGNWGLDVDHPDPYLRLMAIVSVCFNSYGNVDNWLTAFGTGGSAGGEHSNFQQLLRNNDARGVQCHRKVKELKKLSTFVHFLLEIRCKFYMEFNRYKDTDFKNISAEGLFQSTVMHSLDHAQAVKIWSDPLFATPTSKEYEGMAWTSQVARAGFAEELPCLVFPTKFKNSPHPFFQAVYKKARALDARLETDLADSMETCMVR